MTNMIFLFFLISILVTLISAFKSTKFGCRIFVSTSSLSKSSSSLGVSSLEIADATTNAEVNYKSLVVSGFISKENNFAESFSLNKLFKTGKYLEITTVADDLKFARKRIVSPDAVYSGLIDILKIAVVEGGEKQHESLEKAVSGNEAWLSFNVSAAALPAYATIAANARVKRAVFAVYVGAEEKEGTVLTFESACAILSAAKVDYTIIKFASVRKMEESKSPYRIVRGELLLPTEGEAPSSEDLMRVLAEVVDIPKTFNNVYGIGCGTQLDAEISVYMKSQGWPVRVQVGILVGDLMEKIQARYDAEMEDRAAKNLLPPPKKEKSNLGLPKEGEGNKFGGFFM